MRITAGFLVLALGGLAATEAQTFRFNFHRGAEGFQGGFSDYTNETGFDFLFAHRRMPAPLDPARFGMLMRGHNRSDDMFMFMRRQVSGLAPCAQYQAVFRARFASQYPQNSIGIGGSPGASVYFKVGATQVKPRDVNGRMNIDKGNQSRGGRDMFVIGTVGIPGDEFRYTVIERSNRHRPFPVTADPYGRVWLIVGTDSGFEGLTELYYQDMEVVFTRVHATAAAPDAAAMAVSPHTRDLNGRLQPSAPMK